ncbi:MAG: NAD-binding protein [Sphingobacteriales bacterium]|nr:NAD-binding protein [Sphingobacteriales bacterium]MBI3719366.1 NAD-binding protein [Sphingobacteriales bacterium]
MWKRWQLFLPLFVPILILGFVIIAGVAGYMIIEGYNLLDAVYMTIITIASVGFQEVHPLSNSGRIFTIILILVNLGLFTYFITLLSRFFLDGEFIRRYKLVKMENAISQLTGHVIVCGFGRNGRESAHMLHTNGIPFVIVEDKIELPDDLPFEVTHFLKGDATRDEVLKEAGIEKARAIIIALPVDADNLFIVLTAKQLNPKVKIISRASQDSSVNKLKIAGADNVIMPDKIGGAHMASLVMIPDVVEFVSLLTLKNNQSFKVAELEIKKSVAIGELDLWRKTSCTVLGVKNSSHYSLNPPADFVINDNERLIVMGSEEQIRKAKLLV